MRTVSFQGTQISDAQRRQIAFQQQVRGSFLNVHLRETTDKALAEAAAIRDSEDKKFRFDRYETDQLLAQLKRVSAPACCDLFGY